MELDAARMLIAGGAAPEWEAGSLFSTAIHAVSHDPRATLELFARLEADGVDPDGSTQAIAIGAMCQLAPEEPPLLIDAVRLLEEAHELRDEVEVETSIYATVLDALAAAGAGLDAERVLSMATEAGCATGACFEAAVTAAAKADPDLGAAQLKAMRAAQFRPSLNAYNSVMGSFERAGRQHGA